LARATRLTSIRFFGVIVYYVAGRDGIAAAAALAALGAAAAAAEALAAAARPAIGALARLAISAGEAEATLDTGVGILS
jgi:hypothetical protein